MSIITEARPSSASTPTDHRTPASATPRTPAELPDFLGAPFRAETWRAVAYDVTSLVTGAVACSAIVTGLALGLGLAVTLVGVPVLIATLWLAGVGGRIERWRASWVGVEIAAPGRLRDPLTTWAGARARLAHLPSWKQAAYLVVLLPIGVVSFTIAVTTWSYAVVAMTMPFWHWAVGGGSSRPLGYAVQRPIDYVPVVLTGVLAFLASPRLCTATARLQASLAGWLLS